MVAILIISIVFQLIVVVSSIRLITITKRTKSWLAISIAIILMTIRRSVTLYQLVTGGLITKLAWIEELVALCTSFLLAVGIIWIAPIFQSIQATNSALERSLRAQRALSSSNQIIIHTSTESDETTLMQKVCEVIAKLAGYHMVWIGMARQDAEKNMYPAAQCGFKEGFLEQTKFTWDEKETGKGPTGTAIRTGKTTIVKEIEKDPRFHPWRKKVNEQDYHATIAIPLRIEDEIIGALVIYSSDVDAFDEEEVSLLTELAADLSYSINDFTEKRSICPIFCAKVGQSCQKLHQIAVQRSWKHRKHHPSGKKVHTFFENRVFAVESLIFYVCKNRK